MKETPLDRIQNKIEEHNRMPKILEDHNRIQKFFEPYYRIRKIMDSFDNFNKIKEHYDWIHKKIEPLDRVRKIIEPYHSTLESFKQIRFYNENFNEIKQSFERLNIIHLKSPVFNSPFIDQINKLNSVRDNVKRIFEETPEHLLLLAKYGWYLDFDSDFYLPIKLGNKLKKNDIVTVDNFLVDHYSKKIDDIIENLSTEYPDRKKIFKQISNAHKRGQYFISIPAIFTQIDGICYDVTTKMFFIKNKKGQKNEFLPEITNEINNISSIVLSSFLAPIYNETPINANKSIENTFPIDLNRHKIIHGKDYNYGTKKNSLKCISLLKYVSDIFTSIVNINSHAINK